MFRKILFGLAIILLLAGCTQFERLVGNQSPTTFPNLEPTATTIQPTQPVVVTDLPGEPGAQGTPGASGEPGPAYIKIWVPPQMDPAADTPSGKLLKARLDQFSRLHDELVIEVRVKAVTGPAGLLDSLTTTSAAAPLALPDLVALPRESLEAAALKGMLQAVETLDDPVDDTGWYEYARQLVKVQDIAYGLPICGDALVLVYRTSEIEQPPATWEDILGLTTPFVFPAADQQALFPLAMYASQDGYLKDEDGRPFMDAGKLSQVLTLLANAEERGVMPYWLTQYQDDEQVWKAFQDKEANLVVAWLSDYLRELPDEAGFAPLPVEKDQYYTLADGWVWALSSIQIDNRELRTELAKFLSESQFILTYAEALGCLPPYQTNLMPADSPDQALIIDQVAQSARLIPSTDILINLGSPIQQAVMQVLKNQAEPDLAAQKAVETLTSP